MPIQNIAFENIKEFENKTSIHQFEEITELYNSGQLEEIKKKITNYIEQIKSYLKTKPQCQKTRKSLDDIWRFTANLYPKKSHLLNIEIEEKKNQNPIKEFKNILIELLIEKKWKEQCNGKFGGPKPKELTWNQYYKRNESFLQENSKKSPHLLWSIENGHINYFKSILNKKTIAKIKKNPEIFLHIAIKNNYTTIINELIDLNIDINRTDNNKWTALFWAIFTKNNKVTQLLLYHKAKTNIKDPLGLTPLHICALNNNVKAIELLQKNKTKINIKESKYQTTPLQCTLYNNNTDAFESLLKKNNNIHQTDLFDRTLIHIAVINENTKAVKILLKEPINLNQKDLFGRTPLHWAIEKNNLELVTNIVEKNADINIEDNFNDRPLTIAAFKNNSEIMNYLFNQGAR